jgi:hypothetical protein
MNKKFSPCLLLFLFILVISSISVFSFNSYYQWGNSEKRLSGCGVPEFSTCYPQDDLSLNFSRYSLSTTLGVQPIIFRHMSNLYADSSENFVYSFSGSTMSVYHTNDFSLYASNVLEGTILFEPQIISASSVVPLALENPGYNGYYLFYTYSSGGKYYVNIADSNADGNIGIGFNENWEISNSTIDVVFDKLNGDVVTLNSNGNFYIYSFDGTLRYSFNSGTSSVGTPGKTPPNSDKYLSLTDFDYDGYSELFWALPKAYHIPSYNVVIETIGGFKLKDYYGYVLEPMNITVLSESEAFVPATSVIASRLNLVTVGSQNSQPLLHIFISYGFTWGVAITRRANMLYSQNGVNVYTDVVSANGYSVLNTNSVFTDVNYDSYNEMCVIKGTNTAVYTFNCYDSGFNSLFSFSSSQQVTMSMAKFTNNTYESIILRDGIYDTNGTALNKIFNFTLSSAGDTPFPVSLYTKVNYSNDVFIIGTNQLIGYKLSSPSAICGDLICSSTETALLCPIDCFVESGNVTTNKNTGEYCQENSQCYTGLCDLGKCSLLKGGSVCTNSNQCLSGNCDSGHKCTSSGVSNSFKQMINNLFGFSASDGVMIYLIIAVVLFLIGIGCSVYLASFIPAIASMILDVIILVGFTFMEIVPGWVLIVTIIILAIISFILFIITSPQ